MRDKRSKQTGQNLDKGSLAAPATAVTNHEPSSQQPNLKNPAERRRLPPPEEMEEAELRSIREAINQRLGFDYIPLDGYDIPDSDEVDFPNKTDFENSSEFSDSALSDNRDSIARAFIDIIGRSSHKYLVNEESIVDLRSPEYGLTEEQARAARPLVDEFIKAVRASMAPPFPASPAKYEDRPASQGVADFLRTVWKAWIAAGALSRSDLRNLDQKAEMAVRNHIREHGHLPPDVALPTHSRAASRRAAVEAITAAIKRDSHTPK